MAKKTRSHKPPSKEESALAEKVLAAILCGPDESTTVRNRLKKMLTENGMSEKDASSVLKEAIPYIEKLAGIVRWDSPAEIYPDVFYNMACWGPLREKALEWIDKNFEPKKGEPEIWFRHLFK